MKGITLLMFFIVSQFIISQTQTDPLNVLFIGNSLTYYNDLPQTFEAIAEEQGYYINLDQHTPGGTGFVNHVDNVTLYDKLDNTVWDYVILQPGSNESISFSYPIEDTIERAEILRDKIYENSPCASIYLHETSYGIVSNTEASMLQYLITQTLIKNNLIQMSNQTGIPLVPVGEAFKTSIQQNENHFLWVEYGDIHPNAKGSFMGACTFYNAIFQNPILNSAVNGNLSQADANYLRSVAQIVALDNLDTWNIDTLVAHANFTIASTDNNTVNFTNTSTNFDTVSWDFGDGGTSTDSNPAHVFDFSAQTNYNVYLTAYLGCKAHHFVQTISEASLSTKEYILKNHFSVFPNPVKHEMTISTALNSAYSFDLFDVYGDKILSERNIFQNYSLDTSNLSRGLYILTFLVSGKQKSIKILKI